MIWNIYLYLAQQLGWFWVDEPGLPGTGLRDTLFSVVLCASVNHNFEEQKNTFCFKNLFLLVVFWGVAEHDEYIFQEILIFHYFIA